MSKDSAKDLLIDFGLTNKEAEVYLFLAKYEILTGGEIAKQTKIARSLVYRILKSLQTKGLVEPTLESPTRFSAISFEKTIDLIIKTKQEETLQVQRLKKDLLEDWKKVSQSKPKLNREKFVVIENSKKIYSKILQMIIETKTAFSGILTITTLAKAEQYGVFEASHKHFLNRKSKFRFVTNLNNQDWNIMKIIRPRLNSKINLKLKCNIPDSNSVPRVFIRDEEDALFFIRPEVENLKTNQEEVCIFTNCKSLVQTFTNIFQENWQNSTVVDEAIEKCATEKITNIHSNETQRHYEKSMGTMERSKETVNSEIGEWPNHLEPKILKSIGLLKEDEAEILDFASIVGEKFALDVIEKATNFNRFRLLKKFDVLERKYHLIVSNKEGYRFSHPKIRELVYNKITPKLRAEYHFLVAKYLEVTMDFKKQNLSELAYHYYHSGNAQKGVPFLLTAGEEAQKEFLLFDELRFYSQALEMMGTDDKWSRKRSIVFERLGDLYAKTCQHSRANEFYDKAKSSTDQNKTKDRIQNKMRRKVTIKRHREKVDYFVYGKGETAVVFVGYSFHFMPQIHFFSQKYTVVTMDLSESWKPDNRPQEYSLEVFLKYLNLIIDDLKANRVYLVGIGLGGTIAIRYSAEYPNKISKLSFLATNIRPAFNDPDSIKRQRNFWVKAFLNPTWGVKQLREQLTNIMKSVWSEYNVEDSKIIDILKSKDKQIRQLFEIESNIPPEIQLIYYKLSWETDNRPYVERIKIPTLILHGEKDLIPLKAIKSITKKIPGSKLYVFKDGRIVSLFEATKCNRILEEFFTGDNNNITND